MYEPFECPQVEKSGVLDLPKPAEKTLGGHAVMAVGCDDATKRVTVRNSWGADWCPAGYFTMSYSYLEDRNLSDDYWTLRSMQLCARAPAASTESIEPPGAIARPTASRLFPCFSVLKCRAAEARCLRHYDSLGGGAQFLRPRARKREKLKE